MKRISRIAVVLLIALIASLPAIADKAKSLYGKGRDAEARQDYETAYTYFKQAYDLKPKDVRYRASFERNKMLAASVHVHKGQLLRESGKMAEALVEFQTGLSIDPSSFIAQQEFRRTRQAMEDAERPPEATPQASMVRRATQAAGPVDLAAISEAPITLKVTEDTKVIYETVGKLAGINVLFDPDYTSRRIRIELNGVTLGQALEITALESKTFWRPVTPNTIFIAADTPSKRKELEQSVIRTFYLTNLSTPTEIQDVTNTLRQILEINRVQQLPSQGAIVVRGTPDQIALADKLINDIDKSRPEVIVDVAVMQVNRGKLRMLGLSQPFSSSASGNPSVALNNNSTPTTTPGTPGTTATTGGGLTLNQLANLDARNFSVSIPGVTANFLMSDNNTKVIQQPQIRALDGQKASLKIGDRVPVATGSFQPGVGGVGINPLVNTQFQYIDVGVNIDVTPRVHAGREVTLKVMLEISAVTRFQDIGGISQPVIGQRRIEHEIRLKEGEVNLLGGILENSESKSMTGLPWLSQVPILKYFFGQDRKELTENEIVFVLVPHIVRGQDVTEVNLRTIDVGTANAIDLRRETKPAASGAQPAMGNPQQQQQQRPAQGVPQRQQGAPVPVYPAQQPGSQPPAQNPPPTTGQPSTQAAPLGQGPIVSFDPSTINQASGTIFAVNVMLTGAQNAFSVPLQISYDSKILQIINVSNGSFLSGDGQPVALVHRDDPATGALQVTATRPPNSGGVSGDGTVFTLTFQAKTPGQSMLNVSRAMVRGPKDEAAAATGSQAVVTIR